VCILHYVLSTLFIQIVHDKFLFSSLRTTNTNTNDGIATFMLVYFVSTFGLRVYGSLYQQSSSSLSSLLYTSTWLCNTTLLIGGYYCIQTNRFYMSIAYMISCCIDHLLWYIDLSYWLLSGRRKFPIGVAKYISWPTTLWTTKFTCTHHLWTMPMFLYAYNSSQQSLAILNWCVSLRCYLLSCWIVLIHVVLSRIFTPVILQGEYLNVNLSHELWKDITFPFLQISHDNPNTHIYIIRLVWRWWLFNACVYFGILRPVYNYIVYYYTNNDWIHKEKHRRWYFNYKTI